MTDRVTRALRLSFSGDLERRFRDDYYYKSLNALRLSLLLGAVLYVLFSFLDVIIFPETRNAVWAIRFGIVCPAILACLLFTYSRHFKKYMQPAVFTTVVIGGAAIVAMMVVVRSPTNYFHNGGLVLVLMYAYTFSKLRFSYTSLAACVIVLLYEVTALLIMHTPLPALLYDNVLFLSVNLLGMFSNYHREQYIRKDFLQNETVRELEEKRHILEREKILRDLHDGLGGITTNIRLLAEIGKKAKSMEDIKKTLTTISELSQEGLAEIKGFMQSLDGRELTWQSLATEARIRGNALVEPHGFGFSISTSLDCPAVPPSSLLWLNLLKIYKEALTNVVKHSGGKNVSVDLNISAAGVKLRIHDDGRGIRQGATGGRGLSNMWKRAEEIGGSVTVANDYGTVVRLEIPLPLQYATHEND